MPHCKQLSALVSTQERQALHPKDARVRKLLLASHFEANEVQRLIKHGVSQAEVCVVDLVSPSQGTGLMLF